VRALLPEPSDDVDLVQAYALPTAPAARPFVRCNMISSVDGAITVNGKSGALGGAADRQVFETLRALTDVILVGAGTMRAEAYGPAVAPIAVVTRSCDLDWSSPFFTEAKHRPLIVTTRESKHRRRDKADDVADVIVAGDEDVDLTVALAQLHARGFNSVLLEGGPRLNAHMVEAQLLDELCLTLSPRLVAGDGPRVLAGELPHPLDVSIVHLLEADGFLFYRLAIISRT
jgi:riboflavin biosynthesis pyrimidine reductase